jgi:hypothetical protein
VAGGVHLRSLVAEVGYGIPGTIGGEGEFDYYLASLSFRVSINGFLGLRGEYLPSDLPNKLTGMNLRLVYGFYF